jgi:hypothetical protein
MYIKKLQQHYKSSEASTKILEQILFLASTLNSEGKLQKFQNCNPDKICFTQAVSAGSWITWTKLDKDIPSIEKKETELCSLKQRNTKGKEEKGLLHKPSSELHARKKWRHVQKVNIDFWTEQL